MSNFTLFRLKATTAESLMTRDPVHIHVDSTLESAAIQLTKRSFSAMPVLDSDGRIVGVVTRSDIVRRVSDSRATASLTLDSEADGASPDHLDGTYTLGQGAPTRVRELMTREVIAVPIDSPANDAIELMAKRGVHRVFVIDDHDFLVGVISAIDVINRLELE